MKRKLFAILTLCFVACLCLTGLTACDLLPSLQHEYNFNGRRLSEEYLANPATCTEKAKYYYSCDCGAKDSDAFEHGEPLGHNYGAWVSNGDGTHTKTCANDNTHTITENCSGGTATCTEQATCENCGEKYGQLEIHVYDQENVDVEYLCSSAKCEETAKYYLSCKCGANGTTAFEHGEPLGHNYGAWVSNGDGTHTKTCANDNTHTITENCSGGTATCTEQVTCDNCGEKYGTLGFKHNILGEDDYCDSCGKVLDISLILKLSYKLYEGTKYETLVYCELINEDDVLDLGFVKVDEETYVLRNIAEGDILTKALAYKPLGTTEYYSTHWKYYDGTKKVNVYYGCEINEESITTLNESKEIVLYAGVGSYWTPGYV